MERVRPSEKEGKAVLDPLAPVRGIHRIHPKKRHVHQRVLCPFMSKRRT